MQNNYHTHTPRCNHAAGSERDYIETALGAGMRALGFSDHTPYPFPPQYHSGFRMEMGQTQDYFETLRALQREYAGRIDIHIGFEAEYYPSFFEAMRTHVRGFGCEYLLLGQHFLGDELTSEYSGVSTAEEAHLIRYTDQVIAGMRTGAFCCVAHPDLVNWQGDQAVYEKQAARLCRAAKELDVALEINLLGLREHRAYPNPVFWQVAGAQGCRVVLGADAHQPAALLDAATETAARAMAAACGIQLQDTLPLRRP